MSPPNPDRLSKGLASRFRRLDAGASVPGFVLVIAYLVCVLGLGLAETASLAAALLLAGGVAAGIRSWHHAATIATIQRAADASTGVVAGAGDPIGADAARRAVHALPLEMQRARLASVLLPLALVPATMWLLGFGGWLDAQHLRHLAVIVFVASLGCAALVFFLAKRALAETRLALADASDGGVGPSLVEPRHALRTRLLMLASIPAVATAVLLIDFLDVQRAILSRTVSRFAGNSVNSASAVSRWKRCSNRTRHPVSSQGTRPLPNACT